MHQQIKARWVENLRSGRWNQGFDRLADAESGTYCVYGVLAEMASEEGVCAKEIHRTGDVEYDGACFSLPPSVKEWAGIDDDHGPMSTGDALPPGLDLYELNDEGMSFRELADIIEEQM